MDFPATYDTRKAKLFFKRTRRFFSELPNLVAFQKAVSSKEVSLRMIEYACATYSKHCRVVFENRASKTFDLHLSYRACIDSYGKYYFDMFQRGPRVELEAPGQTIRTTIGQLNFFMWALQNSVIDWIRDHRSHLIHYMNFGSIQTAPKPPTCVRITLKFSSEIQVTQFYVCESSMHASNNV